LVNETTIAAWLDIFEYRGVCKECGEPIWFVKTKKNQIVMYTVSLTEHKHDKPKKPPIDEIRKAPGGEV